MNTPEELRPAFDAEIDLGRKRLGEVLQCFEAATAEVRMVASPDVRVVSEEAEDFLQANVRNVPPLRHPHSDRPTEGWGVAAQVGPTQVDTAATTLARRFGDVAALDVSGGIWRRLRRKWRRA